MAKNTQAISRCAQALEALPAYVEGELDDAAARRVRGHLDLCRSCSVEAAAYTASLGALRSAPRPQSPADLYAGFAARLERHRPGRTPRLRTFRLAAATVCIVAVLGAGAALYSRVQHIPGAGNRADAVKTPTQPSAIGRPVLPVHGRTPAPDVADRPRATAGRESGAGRYADMAPRADETRPTTHAERIAPRRRALRGGGRIPSFLDVQPVVGRSLREQLAASRARIAANAVVSTTPRIAPITSTDVSEPVAAPGKAVRFVPAMDEHVHLGNTVTHVQGETGVDAKGRVAVIRVKAETQTDAQTDGGTRGSAR